MTRASDPQTGHALSMSKATPSAFFSAMSITTTSASCLSATPRATMAPTFPAPPTTVTLRFMSAPVHNDQRRNHKDRGTSCRLLHFLDDFVTERRRGELGRAFHEPGE